MKKLRKVDYIDDFEKEMNEASRRFDLSRPKKLISDETNKGFCVIDEEIENWRRKQRAKVLSDLIEDEFDLGWDPNYSNDENKRITYWVVGEKICGGYFDEKGKLHRINEVV